MSIFMFVILTGIFFFTSSTNNSIGGVKENGIKSVINLPVDDKKEGAISPIPTAVPTTESHSTETSPSSSPTPTSSNHEEEDNDNNSHSKNVSLNVSKSSAVDSQIFNKHEYPTSTPYIYPTQTTNHITPTSESSPTPTTLHSPTPDTLDCSYVAQEILSLSQDYSRRGIPLSSQIYKDELANLCSNVSPCSCP